MNIKGFKMMVPTFLNKEEKIILNKFLIVIKEGIKENFNEDKELYDFACQINKIYGNNN